MERRLVPVARTVDARLVPTGEPLSVPEGAFVTLTQTLGGASTIVYNGNMARVEPEDADALGLDPEVLDLPPPADGAVSDNQVWQALRTVHDPEIPVNIVDLGLIYDCKVEDDAVNIAMTLTSPGCGMGPVLVSDVERRVGKVPFVGSVKVELVFDPPWSREMMSDEAQLELGLF